MGDAISHLETPGWLGENFSPEELPATEQTQEIHDVDQNL